MGTAGKRAGAWGRVSGGLVWLAMAAAWALPQAAHAECDLVMTSSSFQQGEPGETVAFSFQVQDPPDFVDAGPCDGASGVIALKDFTEGATLSDTTWSVPAGGGPVEFTLTLGSQRGGDAYIDVFCNDCGEVSGLNTYLGYYARVVDDFDVQLVQPASGLLQATPGSTVSLTAILTVNGAPAIKHMVCWEIVNNPGGDATFVSGQPFCGEMPARGTKGNIIGSPLVGTFVFSDDGSTSVDLSVGQGATSPIQIMVYPAEDMAAAQAITVGTLPVLEAVTSSPITVDTGQSFNVEVITKAIDGSPMGGVMIDFVSNAAPELSPGSQTVATGGNGIATATFTANDQGSYPAGISAVLDPTPANPASGDEQQLSFNVEVTDVVVLSKPTSGSGDNQVAATGEAFAQPLAAQVLRNGSAGVDESVGWEVVSGPASVSSDISGTDANGRAEVLVTAGASAGPVSVRAYLVEDPTQQLFYSLTVQDQTVRTLRMPSTGAGNLQSGTPGAELSPLVAEALDNGMPASGVAINWSVLSGSAILSASQSVTGADGRADVGVTLGQQTGPVRVQATRADEPTATLVYQLNVVNVEQLAIVSGDDQAPEAGSDGEPLVVRFTRNGQPVGGQLVEWSVQSGDATVTPATSTTNSQGQASTAIAFGPEGGNVVVRASAGNAAPVQFAFTVDGGSGPPPEGLTLARQSGNDQRGAPGSLAEQPLVVIARNSDGEPVAGVPVGWRVLSGSAELDAADVLTGEDGRASVGFRFAQQSGPVVIRASSFNDLTFVDFDAEAFAPDVSVVSGDGQRGQPGEPLPEDFVIAIAEPVAAKALQGTQVTWTIVEGDGSLASPVTTTDAQGQSRNRLTLGSSGGTYRVRAQVPGGDQVEFSAVAGGSGALTSVSGDAQTLPTETLSEPLVVELRDASGNPVEGVTLQWSGDNAALEQETTTTDAQGRSSNRARVLLPGAASITVTSDQVEVEPLVFAINAGVINTDGLAPNERDVADAVDQLCPALANLAERTPEQEDLLARCLELVDNSGDDPDGVADALEEMLQDVALTQVNAALLTASAQFDNLKARIAALRSGARGFSVAGLNVAGSGGVLPLSLLQADEAGGGEVGADFGRWGFFASGTIGRGEVDAGQATPEYDFDTAGLTAGVDYRVNDRWIVGGAFGFSRQDTEVAGERGKVDTDGWSLSAYTTWFNQNSWYVDGVLTWGSNDYELERRIQYSITSATGDVTSVDQLARADSEGNQLAAAVSFGRDFQRGAWNFGPYFRGTWTRVDFDAYAEQLEAGQPGSGLGLLVDARDVTSATAVLGGKLSYTASRDWGILMPHVNLEWEHEFKDDPQAIVMRFLHDPTQTPIAITGDPLDTDYFNVGIGLSALFPGGKSGFVYYEHLVGASGISQGNLAIGLRIEF